MSTRAFAFILTATVVLASAAFAQTAGPSWVGADVPAPGTATFPIQQPGHWRLSQLDGLDVYNSNDQRIGEIRDLVVDRDGHVDAVVIGVGGFFGFHEHDVAVPFDQITWVGEREGRGGAEIPRAYPEHALLNMTKDQLFAAPEFADRR